MKNFIDSLFTKSYWSHLISMDSLTTFFAVIGGISTLLEIANQFGILDENKIDFGWFAFFIFIAFFSVLIKRWPIFRFTYKVPKSDLCIEVIIKDLFKISGQKIISTNATFDTDIANGLISPNSVQGQFTEKLFPQNIKKLDQEIEDALSQKSFATRQDKKGKTKEYEIGTTVKLTLGREIFYLLAMAKIAPKGNAYSNENMVRKSLKKLWDFLKTQGEKEPIVIPLIGTGRGRVSLTRKQMICLIAQSFIEASKDKNFSNKLIIAIDPDDAKENEINLYKVRDTLNNYI